ncbi:fasciculation and elongation protein zeta-2-like [Dendronephthya gigantea]|uniref:fasciculation and elongation protein zeta-2-like n=1 Tax=Dendronephthya gigantea TaxID=151771 RepID=UPI0010698F84|nr:fasciculation and elongation protein zeta-2-like [Dendronephthya gigantea]
MADETDQTDEWLDFSSSCFENQETLFEAKDEETQDPEEDLKHEINGFSKLEDIHELLKQSLPDTSVTTHVRQKTSSSQCTSDISALNESCKHWIWVELISKLNAVRQPKWMGSCLEECFCRSLQVSKDLNEKEQPQIESDHSCKDFFNFHKIYQLIRDDSIQSVELTDTVKEELTKSLDDNFEDIDAELEWSDNDVKDNTSLSNASLSSSGINENEATAELVCLPYKEVLHLRDELRDYTKQYSDILVVELENRDAYIREKELKNDFISSFLSVQEKLREVNSTTSKKKFSLQSSKQNNPPNSQSLTTIPYEIKNGGPSIDILEKLIEIMEAMKTNSPNVPTLLTNYILNVLCK